MRDSEETFDIKFYWKNLLMYFGIVGVIIVMVAFMSCPEDVVCTLDFASAFSFVGLGAILALGHLIARNFAISKKKKTKRILSGKFDTSDED